MFKSRHFAVAIIPWIGWQQSGDPRIIDENWAGMQAYLAEIEQRNSNGLWQHNFGAAFGDWLTPPFTTPEDLLATACRAGTWLPCCPSPSSVFAPHST